MNFFKETGSTSFLTREEFFARKDNFAELQAVCIGKARRWGIDDPAKTPEDYAMIAIEKFWFGYDLLIAHLGIKDLTGQDAVNEAMGFIHEVAKNSFISEHRKWIRKQEAETMCQDQCDDERVLDLSPFLAMLPKRQRAVIERSYGLGGALYEQPDERIAEELEISRQTVFADRTKGLETMRKLVGKGNKKMSAA